MTLPGNGTTKRIIAGIVVAVAVFLAGAVLSNSNRITAAEAQIRAIYDTQADFKQTMETNRVENRDEHKEIKGMLGEIAKEVRK